MLGLYQGQYPDHQFVLAEYFGYHEKLQLILNERVREAIEGSSSGEVDLVRYEKYADENGHHHGHTHHHVHEHQ